MLNQPQAFLQSNGYEVYEYLGKGSYSIVYKCKNPYDELVAVKLFRCAKKSTREREFASIDELEKMKPLDWENYPNFEFKNSFIERAKSYDEHMNKPRLIKKVNGSGFSIIECPLANADTFESVISSKSPIDYKELSEIGKSVLKALQVLHTRGLVHLDVKPDNILLFEQNDGKVKYQLCDFGFMDDKLKPAKDSKDDKKRGSPQYAAPEIINKLPLNYKNLQKADIYSLGATLFQMYLAKKGDIDSGMHMARTIENFQNGIYGIGIISEEEGRFLDLIKMLTDLKPDNRPSAVDALNHPFFKQI